MNKLKKNKFNIQLNKFFIFLIIIFSISASIFAAPDANAGNQQTVNVGQTVSFSGSTSSCSSCSITSYTWNFQDGTSNNGVSTTHSYDTAGVYDVVLVVVTNTGEIDSDTVRITVQNQDAVDPTITHDNVTSATAGSDKVVTATVTDNVGLASVKLYYASINSSTYASTDMTATGESYRGSVPASKVVSSGFKYYIKATDNAGNEKLYPVTAPTSAINVTNIQTNDTIPPTTILVSVASDTSSPYLDSTNDGFTPISLTGESGMACRWATNDTTYSGMSANNECSVTGASAVCNASTSSAALSDGSGKLFYVSCKDSSQNANSQNSSTNTNINFTLDTTGPVVNSFSGSIIALGNASLSWNVNDATAGLKNVKLYRSTKSNMSGASLLTTGAKTSTGYVDTTLSHSVKYYYKIVTTDNAGHITNSSIINLTDTTIITVSASKNISNGTVSFTTGSIKSYVNKITGLSGVNNVTVEAKNSSELNLTISNKTAEFRGLSIDLDNSSFSGNATVVFFIDKTTFEASSANTSRIFIDHFKNGSLRERITANYMELDATNGYKFNFTTNGFSDFIPVYVEDNSTSSSSSSSSSGSSSSSSGSSGGGGGGGSSSKIYKKSSSKYVRATDYSKDKEITIKPSIDIVNSLTLTPSTSKRGVVLVESLTEQPEDTEKLNTQIYAWLEMKIGLEKDEFDEVEIEFVIEKEWLNDNNLENSDVLLLIDEEGAWRKLPPSVVDESDDEVTYTARIPHFSYFAITHIEKEETETSSSSEDDSSEAKELAEVESPFENKELEKEIKLAEESQSEEQTKSNKSIVWIIVILIALIAIGVIIHFKRKGRKGGNGAISSAASSAPSTSFSSNDKGMFAGTKMAIDETLEKGSTNSLKKLETN